MDTGTEYIAYCRRRLLREYYPRIQTCLEQLSEEDLWWRPNKASNSIGNLMLHLCGNVRQWIIHGIGGEPDTRHRSQEFDERSHVPADELLNMMRQTLSEADATLERFDNSTLLVTRHIQGFELTALDAISHVVEHFAQHTAQIIYITKMRKGGVADFFSSYFPAGEFPKEP